MVNKAFYQSLYYKFSHYKASAAGCQWKKWTHLSLMQKNIFNYQYITFDLSPNKVDLDRLRQRSGYLVQAMPDHKHSSLCNIYRADASICVEN